MVKDIVKDILENNAMFTKEDTSVYDTLQDKQAPNVTLLMCADSRVPTCVVSQDTINRVFTIENIGNQIKTAEGSVDYGVMHLKTPLLLVLGHTQCGAVKACFNDLSKETKGIKRELEFLSDGLAEMDYSFPQEDPKRLDKFAELNVDYQVNYALEKYKEQIENGDLVVVGMMMDFTNSYSEEKCKVHITNVNGQTSPEMISEKLGDNFEDKFRRLVK